jgi:flagellar biosynthesis/type III secretory pathway protein FliH
MPVPKLGYCVAIRAPKGSVRVDKLRVDPADFRLLDETGNVNRYPYLVVEVQADTRRADWFKIPELASAYKEIQEEYRRGRQQAVEEALATFRRVALTCNDLQEADARQLADKVLATYASSGPPAPAVRGSSKRQADLPELSEIGLYSD